MNQHAVRLAAFLFVGSAVSFGCSSDEETTPAGDSGSDTGGSFGTGGAHTGGATSTGGAHTGGATSTGGAATGGGTSTGGAATGGGTSTGGTPSTGGASGTGGAATGGASGAGTGGNGGTGAKDGGATDAGGKDGGGADASDAADASDGSPYTQAQIDRGAYLVHSVALCGGCHTATGGAELAGNPKFKNGALPAPNLTSDPTGVGDWTDQQIIDAFRNGVDDEGRNLDKAMPYLLFHNMTDGDAMAIVAFLRSLPHVSSKVNDAAIGEANPDAGSITPLSPADFPDTSLPTTDANYAAAQQGKYLVSSLARCVSCHSPSAAGVPTQPFFSGVAPTNNTQIFSSNITPDATGIQGWTAADVATALKVGTNKTGRTLCGSMPSGAKGYGGLTDADANAIGVYLTTIPAVSNAAADPSLEPVCP